MIHLLALAESFLQLLAFGGQLLCQRRAQALTRCVPLDHNAVRLLQALGQCLPYKQCSQRTEKTNLGRVSKVGDAATASLSECI